MEESYKEVYFHEYCKTCKHEKVEEDKEPCHDCLNEPVNVFSHRPICWEGNEEKPVKTKNWRAQNDSKR